MKYRPEIDGLRSIAVLPVILFHAGFTWMSGGYVGVDVFFVISGYLITTILLSEISARRFSLLRFYERRARRILPALFVVMAACFPFGWIWMLQSQFLEFAESVAATTLFISNILYWTETGYFAAAAEENPLLHTWSLAVEEQYYLLFPPLLALCMLGGRRFALGVVAAIAVVSLGTAYLAPVDQAAKFFLTHMRIWELLAGALCAFALQHRAPWRNGPLAALGLALVICPILLFDARTPFPHFAILPVAGTALIILCAGGDTRVAKLLSMRAFVGIGLVSYSAYLWHQPLFAFARIKSVFAPSPALMLALAGLSLLLAWATWAWVERPFRGNPPRALPRRWQVFVAAFAGMVIILGATLYVGEQDGVPGRRVMTQIVPPLMDARAERFRTWEVLERRAPARFDLDRFDADGPPVRLLILGDSHSKGLFNALYLNPELFSDIQVRWLGIGFACGQDADELDVESVCLDQQLEAHPDLYAQATHVLLSARWSIETKRERLPDYAATIRASGKQLLVAGNTQEYRLDAPDMILQVARDSGCDGEGAFDADTAAAMFFANRADGLDAVDAHVRAAAESAGARFLDRRALVCDRAAGRCSAVTPGGDGVVYDYAHWTLAGARFFGKKMAATGWLGLP